MNGERESTRNPGATEGGARSDQVFARPAWLEEFAPAQAGPGDDWGSGADDRRRHSHDDEPWDLEPTGWRATVDRVRTTPRAAVALVAVGVIAAVVAAVAVFGSPGPDGSGEYPTVDFAGTSSTVATATAGGRSVASVPSAGSSAAQPAAELVVAVVGMVRLPGLHRLSVGARVADALTAARGTVAGADTASLNLAQPVRDGDQIVVGVSDRKAAVQLRSSVVSAAAGVTSGADVVPNGSDGSGGGKVNINTAGAADLDRLPGVGAATAAAIIAYREQNGPFASVDDLAKVSGIGAAKLARMAPMATV